MYKKFLLIAFMTYPLIGLGAPFEIKVHDELIASENESAFEVETNLHQKSNSEPFHGIFFQTRLEYAYGISQNSEISINAFTSVYSGNTYLNGGKLAYMYILEHDESGIFHYGIKNEINYIRAIGGGSQTFIEITPILAFQLTDWRLTLNPSLDIYLSGNTETYVLAPSAKLQYELSKDTFIGAEYYSELSPAGQLSSFSQRPDMAYLIFDKSIDKKSNLNVGIGQSTHSNSDKWAIKLIYALSFE